MTLLQFIPGGGCASTIPSKNTLAPSSTAFPSILTVNFGVHTSLGFNVYAGPVNGPYVWQFLINESEIFIVRSFNISKYFYL